MPQPLLGKELVEVLFRHDFFSDLSELIILNLLQVNYLLCDRFLLFKELGVVEDKWKVLAFGVNMLQIIRV